MSVQRSTTPWRMLLLLALLLATLLVEESGAFVLPRFRPHLRPRQQSRVSISITSSGARERCCWCNPRRHKEALLAGANVNGDKSNDDGTVAVVLTPTANGDTVPPEDEAGVGNVGAYGGVNNNNNNKNSIFDLIAGRSAVCLYQSDLRRDAVGKAAGKQASSATNWIHDASAFALQQTMDQLRLKSPEESLDRDEATAWWRWIRSVPAPTVLDLSHDFCRRVNLTLTDEALAQMDQKRGDFLGRLGCRIITFPSGAALSSPLTEPPASIIYGKLLYGGVTRYRLLGSHNSNSNSINKPPRKAGQRTEVQPTSNDKVDAWMQYGGPDRMYEAVDMGPAAVLEVLLLPRGKNLPRDSCMGQNNMVIQGMAWKPQDMFGFWDDTKLDGSSDKTTEELFVNSYTTASRMRSGKERNDAFRSDFTSVVGGLQPQIDAIVRRVLDGRVIRPADDDGGRGVSDDSRRASSATSETALEAEELELLGLTPCRGLLLYGV